MDAPAKAVLTEVVKILVQHVREIANFRSTLHFHRSTLLRIQPMFDEIDRLNRSLNRPTQETKMFTHLLREGKEIDQNCSTINSFNIGGKLIQSRKLRKWYESLVKFLETEGLLRDIKKVMLDNGRRSGSSGSCGVPELPDGIVAFDEPLRELKDILLLNDEVPAVVLSAPGGCGKTTLAKLLCHDDEIKGIFEDNIFFVTVSKTPNLYVIIRRIFQHKGRQPPEFLSDEDAINQLKHFLKELELDPILLVLDDVWSEWQSYIYEFMFPKIPGFKIMITSRDVFPEFGVTYNLRILEHKDAIKLFRHSAFPQNWSSNVPDDLVDQMVKGCKGFPLALIVVGRSLCRQAEAKWRTTLDNWSKGQSIFDSNRSLFRVLQTSIDSLDEKTKELYLDLALYPEDQEIPATALMDMWVELYNLDEKGMHTIVNLHELSFKNLVNLVNRRKDDIEVDCYCNERYVMQHDLLRELAIHLTNQEPVEQRKRLIVDLHNSKSYQSQQPVHAQILSISTDETIPSIWCAIELPEVEAVVLNFQSDNYTLPQFMQKMDRLKVLIVTNYGYTLSRIDNLPLLGDLSSLRRIRLEHVSISSLGTSLMPMMHLRKISLFMCKIGDTLDKCTTKVDMFPSLVEIEIDYCDDLVQYPVGLCKYISTLEKISITNCNELRSLPEEFGRLTNVEVLRLHSCIMLEELPEAIGNLHKLSILDISDCVGLCKMPDRTRELCGLRKLHMRGCVGIRELPPSVEELRGLQHVICDEEIYNIWISYEELAHVNIKLVRADINLNWLHNHGPGP